MFTTGISKINETATMFFNYSTIFVHIHTYREKGEISKNGNDVYGDRINFAIFAKQQKGLNYSL